MPDFPTILLVDDEDAVQKLLAYPLEREGYRVVPARDGQEALDRFASENPDLVVLDITLPRLDGLEVCKQLRARSTVPIIMLTARDDELDKVVGLELGADDYITKPFSIREFRSRVRALLRRAKLPPYQGEDGEEVISADELKIDVGRRTVELSGTSVQLTYVEFELLRTMAAAPGRVFSRKMLLGVDIAIGSPPQRPDARIQKAVRDVQEEDGDDQEEGVDCRESEDDRSIKDRDGLEEQEAEAGVIENSLGDDRAGPGCCEGQSQRCHNRGRGRAQDVSGEYIAFLQSLGPSREDEILVHHLKDEISGRVGP